MTTTINTKTGEVSVVDKKETLKVKTPSGETGMLPGGETGVPLTGETGVAPQPEIAVCEIPGPAVETIANKKPEIKKVVEQVKTTYTKGTVEFIEIENYGTVEKVAVVVKDGPKTVLVDFLVNPKTKDVQLIQTSQVSETVKSEFYSEKTNKYG